VNRAARLRDERGLMGKIAIVWFLLLALFVVAAVDVGSVALTRFKVANAADKAAFQAAATFKNTADRNHGFAIDARTGDVTVKVVKRAWSLIAGRLSQTKPYTKVSATSSSEPPTL